ncbi:subtilisin-like protein [Obba rivulosa]|uniref:Subtilisin-like protein n=1 Tax=Obba rivulosa TaxID=1052685 RepID=A0A8E2DMC1_9APHY|nr:subtilisin-like protein [Obba rivulosa]
MLYRRLLTTLALSILLSWLSLLTHSSSLSRRVPHETRRSIPHGWQPIQRAEPSMVLPLRIGLAQSNTHLLESFLNDVSHPVSPNYGKHWSPAKVAETFRPSNESLETVRAWLADNGIQAHRTRVSHGGGWIHTDVTIEEAEALLGTDYYVYQNAAEDREHIACGSTYHLPEHVSKHVELITPTLHFDVPKRRSVVNRTSKPSVGGGPRVGPKIDVGHFLVVFNDLDHCDEQITLDCLRALYNFQYEFVSNMSTIGVVEMTPETHDPSDLDVFFGNFSTDQVGERPILVGIDGGVILTGAPDSYLAESSLDLQYAMGLVGKNQSVLLYQVGDPVEGGSFNNLLDALDATFCTFEGGDDPTQDGVYPDTQQGGFDEPEQCGSIKPADVITNSYGYNEAELTPFYMTRQCTEYGKLGLMGVTFLYASGDSGVGGNGDLCLEPNGTQAVGAAIFNPGFPGGCPWVTNVGATQISPGNPVTAPETASAEFGSGGGWSNVFAMPDYQKSAVQGYLKEFPPSFPSNIWNSTGISRAYPDIAGNGWNYTVAIDGEFFLIGGTSAASPMSAAMLTAINDARLSQGKSPIGFINPTIYSDAFQGLFNDITTGSNPGCGTDGFTAEVGWDPVTGLGTINFQKLLAAWLELP